jgi:hypothetical protein
MRKILGISGKRQQGPGVVPSRKVAAGTAFTGLWPPSCAAHEDQAKGAMTIRVHSEDAGQQIPHMPKETWQANVTDKGEKQ